MSTTSGDTFRFGEGRHLNKRWDNAEFSQLAVEPYFVDKSHLLEKLFPLINTATGKYICVTRPRRFGKTTAAEMIAAFFGRGDTSDIFDGLKIASRPGYAEHLNQHNVIHLSMLVLSSRPTFQEFIDELSDRILPDLAAAYPEVLLKESYTISRYFEEIYLRTGDRFIFVIDEWEVPLRTFTSVEDKQLYLDFLRALLKGAPYVEMAYLTGIVPITNYTSGSELNMFKDYTFISDPLFATSFGFTSKEIDTLYEIYRNHTPEPSITRKDLTWWYDGYGPFHGVDLYNPRSVVTALNDNQLGNYWTNTGANDEIFDLVRNNVEGVRDDLEKLIAGETINANINEFGVQDSTLRTRNSIFSAMVVYGLLTSGGSSVRIPNNELRQKFISVIAEHPEFGPLQERMALSQELLTAIQNGDTTRVAEIIQFFHSDKSTVLTFNRENDLANIVDWALYGIQNQYNVSREQPAGVGFADMLVLPTKQFHDDCLIIELKIDADPQDAIEQITQRRYMDHIVAQPQYTGRIIAVGISYQRSDPNKTHHCAIKVLREAPQHT